MSASTDALEATAAVSAGLAAPMPVLKRRAMWLGSGNAFDLVLQFLLPVVLVRSLDATDFGQYRLLWLAIMTVMAVAPLGMPQSLYYFLPRSGAAAKRLYVHQTLLYLVGAGLLGGWAISSWNPWLPDGLDSLREFGFLVPALMMLWAASHLLDFLPTIEEKVVWQAWATISLALLRALVLSAAAFLTGDLRLLIWLLIAHTALKFMLLLYFVSVTHGLGRPWWQWRSFVQQFRQAVPFGISVTLYSMRSQIDQWVAATLFSLQSFAAFSVAAVLGPLVNLSRLSINHAFLPSMSRLQAAGDVPGMLQLNSQANVMVGRLVYPLLAFVFVYAEEVVTLVYTATYIEAAPVMRLYIVSLVAMVVELVSVTLLMKEGAFVLRLNVLILILSFAISWFAAHRFGLAGAAAGSVGVIYIDRLATLQRIALRTGIPLGKLQNWRALAVLLLFSALAAAVAWGVTTHFFIESSPLLRLVIGSLTLVVAYAAMVLPYGLRATPTPNPLEPKG